MKRIISLTLTLLLIMGALFAFPASAESKIITSGDWKYKIMDDGNLRLYGYYGDSTDLTVPDTIDGHKITKILSVGYKTKTLRIGKNIEKISVSFLSSSLNPATKIVVSKANKEYSSKNGLLLNKKGNMLVAYPGGIKGDNIKLPKTVTYIGKNACAHNSNFKRLVIPKNVKRIGDGAFFNCKNLTYVKLPKTVNKIDDGAFEWNPKLEKVVFDEKHTYTMGQSVFQECKSLKTVTVPKIKKNYYPYNGAALYSDCNRIKSVNIVKGAKFIPAQSFEDCKRLKTIKVPSSVKLIENRAFGFKWDEDSYKYIPNPDFTIKGTKGSAAYKYAKKNGIKFKAV